jgi:hypothetical protein
MGVLKEPEGVDLYVNSKPLSEKEKMEISEIIAHYKKTGRKKKMELIQSRKKVMQKKAK